MQIPLISSESASDSTGCPRFRTARSFNKRSVASVSPIPISEGKTGRYTEPGFVEASPRLCIFLTDLVMLLTNFLQPVNPSLCHEKPPHDQKIRGHSKRPPINSPMDQPATLFTKIKAAVTDIGGLTSHAAIVSREYGLPSVTGTGIATAVIKTGDIIKVDGSAGTVVIVKRVAG